jgi:hypothetical protein
MPYRYSTQGPAGGVEGEAVAERQIPAEARITAFQVWADDVVHQVALYWGDPDPGSDECVVLGTLAGTSHPVVRLDGDTKIASITGRCGEAVSSLMLIAESGDILGSYGGPGGTATFTFEVPPESELAGLVGRVGLGITALGVVYRSETYI